MNDFSKQYQIYCSAFEEELKKLCDGMQYQPQILTESMRYSLLNGGKRLRPVLFLSTLDALEYDFRREMPLALALECVHTYSLIHDDLPALDNDDFRRGKPSCHKAFGEANAILAGDALLSLAFDLMLSVCGKGSAYVEASAELSRAAGAEGMLAGQVADIYYEDKDAGKEELRFVQRHKTAKLLEAPVVMAGILAGGDRERLRSFGNALGELFQITDDLLDVKGDARKLGKSIGKDEKENKLTAVKVYGIQRAEALALECAKECKLHLNNCNRLHTDFLCGLVDFILNRAS